MPEFRINGLTLALPDALATPDISAKLNDGSYEADEARAADRCVRPGFRVLDLGSGLGYIAALCAQKAGAENVLTVEANPDLLPVIESNLAANGQADVSVLHGAVTDTAEEGATASFAIKDTFTGSSLTGTGTRRVDVPLIPITDLIRAHRPHVILMDIEGAEANLFKRRWTCPLRYFVLELHPKRYGPEVIKKIVDFMSAMDMTYDPVVSRGKVLGFRKVWGGADT
ncbi:MAG: FkbM family methyltransferase [Pseudomonadota bacterium]